MTTPQFHLLTPGRSLQGDWYNCTLPDNIEVGPNTVIDSSYCFKNYRPKGRIGLRVGRDVTIWRASLSVEPDGFLEIGDESYIVNSNVVCSGRIRIGSGVYLGGGVTVVDSDFHPISPAGRLADSIALSPGGNRARRPPIDVRPVVIEDDVWVGYHATILKGVRVGAGAIVQPCAVVTKDVAAGTMVGGNPAREISREEEPWADKLDFEQTR
jgi:acetyltransferase-like isoleucine patch superfamily enzyme